MGLAHSNDALDVTRRDGNTARVLRLESGVLDTIIGVLDNVLLRLDSVILYTIIGLLDNVLLIADC